MSSFVEKGGGVVSDNLHNGHRKRLKEELLNLDFPEAAPPHQILETLLFYGIPRKDTNLIAHALIERFGSLSAVFEADPHDLFEVSGMTHNAVSLIKMVLPIARLINTEKEKGKFRFTDMDQCGEYLVKKYFGHSKELFIITGFNREGNHIFDEIVAVGDSENVAVSVKNIVKVVIRRNPSSVVISHNHVNSPAVPSLSDIQMTQSLKFTLDQINVRLIDHLIISGDDYVSIRQSSDYKHIF